jgi:2-polyprenyl-3-methyl-5-hydroxy-6-metoxy-1,4-benzoquinol methylase
MLEVGSQETQSGCQSRKVSQEESAMSTVSAAGARAADHIHLDWLAEYRVATAGSLSAKSLLDLGCGSGYLCAEAMRQGARHVVGVDMCPPDLPPQGWHYLSLDLDAADWPETLPKGRDEGFDFIYAFDILEHLNAPAKFLQLCLGLLSAQGQLVLTTPNTSSWERFVKGAGWSGATDPQHKILFNRYALDFLLRRVGFKAEILRAPVRSLARAHIAHPQVGAQIFCVAVPAAR